MLKSESQFDEGGGYLCGLHAFLVTVPEDKLSVVRTVPEPGYGKL